MSDDQLYEVARKRVHQRNRRWTLWALDLGVLILLLATLIMVGSTWSVALFLGWGAVFVTHTIIAGFAESTQGSIESEVAKLRAGMQYEKPKRLELGEDGELVETFDRSDEQRVHRN
jgi:uncharacterized membrane protein